jgi:hypothetical protein
MMLSETRFTLGRPPVLTRSGLTYGAFFEVFDFVASSTLSVPAVGVVAALAVAVSVATESVASVDNGVVGWGEGEGGDTNVD